MPPVMAHVVSTSPKGSAVAHSAASRSSWCRAAVQTANGTVSSARMRCPLPRMSDAFRGPVPKGTSTARARPSRTGPLGGRHRDRRERQPAADRERRGDGDGHRARDALRMGVGHRCARR